jgi:hypothetical protein
MDERAEVGSWGQNHRGRVIGAGKLALTMGVSSEISLEFGPSFSPFLVDSALPVEFDLTYRKQKTEKFLVDTRTHINDFAICSFPGPIFPDERRNAEGPERRPTRIPLCVNSESKFSAIIFLD